MMEPYQTLSSIDDAGADSKPRAAHGKVRKRAAKACLSCRARKVRCDVSLRGPPCMNCHLDHEECIVTGRASRFPRNRRDTDGSTASVPPYLQDGEERAELDSIRPPLPPASTPGSDRTDPRRDSIVEPPLPRAALQMPTPATTTSQQQLPLPTLSQSLPPISHLPAYQPPLTQHQAPIVPNYTQATMLNPWAYQQPLRMTSDVVYSYYPFLSITNLHNIPAQDANFLESQDCLRVPTRAVMNEFLQQYFLHVHPLLPLFNEGDFWDMYLNEGLEKLGMVRGRMSLLVLQSLLFATCNFVGRESIKALGFPSIRAARAGLYRRAKLLYDFESESSPISIAQAALLLSYWSSPVSSHGARKPNSNWLNVAIQHAKVAETHHYPSIDTSTPAKQKQQNILKRIWWCCVVRDRVMSLCVRRTIQITEAHFDFYGNEPLMPGDLEDEFSRSKVYDAKTKRALAEILANLLDLCVLLTDVLVLVYPLDERPGWGRQMKEMDIQRLRQGRIELARWYGKTSSLYPVFGGDNRGQGLQHDSVVLYTNLMYMYYHSSRVALCHHEVLHLAVASQDNPSPTTDSPSSSSPSTITTNRQELQDAATGVTECLKELIIRRLARWLPVSAVACTALPLVLHILDVKLSSLRNSNSNSSNTTFPSASSNPQAALKQHRLNILIEAMKTYQPQYDGVDKISDTIRHIVNLAQLDASSNKAGKIRDWTDILTSHPSLYLRLALTMDLSLSKDRLPVEGDFPASLRGLLGTGGGGSNNPGMAPKFGHGERGVREPDLGSWRMGDIYEKRGLSVSSGQPKQQQQQQNGVLMQPQQQQQQPSKGEMKKWLENDRSCGDFATARNGLLPDSGGGGGDAMDIDSSHPPSNYQNNQRINGSLSSAGTGSSSSFFTTNTYTSHQHPQTTTTDIPEDIFQPFTLEEMDVLEAHVLDAFTLQNDSPGSSEDAIGFFGRALGEDADSWFADIGVGVGVGKEKDGNGDGPDGGEGEGEGVGENTRTKEENDDETARLLLEALKGGS